MVDIGFAGEPIPDSIVREIWQKLFPTKPYPNIIAFNVKPRRYHNIIAEAQQKGLIDTALEEHGHEVPFHRRAGFVFLTEVKGKETYVIVRKSTTRHTVEEVLTHEMQHVLNMMQQGQEVRRTELYRR